MQPDANFTQILSSLIEAPLQEERWEHICDMLAHRYNGHFVFYTFDMSRPTEGRLWLSKGFRDCEGLAEVFSKNESPEEVLANRRIASAPAFRFLTELDAFDVADDADIPPMPFRDELHSILGTSCRGGAKLNDNGPWLDVGSVHRPGKNSSFPVAIRRELEFLFPLFGKTLETGRVLSALLGQYGALMDLFDRLDFGAAFIDIRNRSVLSNAALKFMASDGDALLIDGMGFPVPTLGDPAAIASVCNAARDSKTLPSSTITLLDRRSGGRPLIVKASTIYASEVSVQPLVLAMFIDPETRPSADVSALSVLGNLTEAEQEVCRLLVEGFDTAEIAAHRETALATTRTQVKAAQAKLACRSRLDILRLALATAPPVRNRIRQMVDDGALAPVQVDGKHYPEEFAMSSRTCVFAGLLVGTTASFAGATTVNGDYTFSIVQQTRALSQNDSYRSSMILADGSVATIVRAGNSFSAPPDRIRIVGPNGSVREISAPPNTRLGGTLSVNEKGQIAVATSTGEAAASRRQLRLIKMDGTFQTLIDVPGVQPAGVADDTLFSFTDVEINEAGNIAVSGSFRRADGSTGSRILKVSDTDGTPSFDILDESTPDGTPSDQARNFLFEVAIDDTGTVAWTRQNGGSREVVLSDGVSENIGLFSESEFSAGRQQYQSSALTNSGLLAVASVPGTGSPITVGTAT